MRRQGHWVGIAVLVFVLALLVTCGRVAAESYAGKTVILSNLPFPNDLHARDPHIDYNIDASQVSFLVRVPAQYAENTPFGVVVYLAPDNAIQQIPAGWDAVLDQRKLIFIAPQKAGNDVAVGRRMGLAVDAALSAKHLWNIDGRRVFVAGYGEGARTAGLLGFDAPSVFVGSIQMGGADFFKPLPPAQGTAAPAGRTPYGLLLSDATAAEINAAGSFRFAFLTGHDDPHYSQIAAIVHDGYAKIGFHCTLIETPGIGQGLCPPRRLSQALDFLEGIKTAEPTTRPAAPAWMSKDPRQWPRILLSNRVLDAQGRVGEFGSAAFARLPDGAVVLCTARHLLGETSLADFAKEFKSWTAYGANPAAGVRMTRVALDPSQPASFDALVLCPASQDQSWPGAVLPIRQEPLEIGETVYLAAVPHNQSRDRQQVFKGMVTRNLDDKQFEYDVDGQFDTMGCSGAPVVDEYGRLAAINVGHLLTQSIPGKEQLTCVAASDVLGAIRLPADVHPVQEQPVLRVAAAAPAVSAQDPTDQRANAALRRAQLLLDNKIYAKAREQLQAIVDGYPNTEAAKRARAMLAQIPDR